MKIIFSALFSAQHILRRIYYYGSNYMQLNSDPQSTMAIKINYENIP